MIVVQLGRWYSGKTPSDLKLKSPGLQLYVNQQFLHLYCILCDLEESVAQADDDANCMQGFVIIQFFRVFVFNHMENA